MAFSQITILRWTKNDPDFPRPSLNPGGRRLYWSVRAIERSAINNQAGCVEKMTKATKLGRITECMLSILLLVLGAIGTAGAEPLERGTIDVVDSKGRWIGPYINLANADFVVRKVNGVLLELPLVNPSGFYATGVRLFFTSADCSGQSYIGFQAPRLLNPLSGGGIVQSTLYYQNSTPLSLVPGSAEDISGDGTTSSCNSLNQSFASPFATYWTFDLSDLNFTPPFDLRVPGMREHARSRSSDLEIFEYGDRRGRSRLWTRRIIWSSARED